MKITKTASGKKAIKISKSEWQAIGEKQGWTKKAQTAIPVNETGPGTNPNDVYNQHQTQNNPQQQQQQSAPASAMTFNALMQDPNFQQTFNTIKKQRANEAKILQYWKGLGINYTAIPEILEVIG